jgi:hypothetical protein
MPDQPPAPTWVIVHPEWGVYAGHALGMAFFSLQDVGAQPVAATFETKQHAIDHIRSWRNDGLEFDPKAFEYRDVYCDNPAFATPDEMAAAGIAERMLEPFRLAEIENAAAERDLAAAMRLH